LTETLQHAPSTAAVGTTLTHRRYVDFGHAHYAGNLVDGAFVLSMFGDIATDLCLHTEGDEGLFAAYSEVTFHAPVHAGDVLQVSATITRVGNRSRTVRFEAHILVRSRPEELAVSAVGTVVVPGR
jgi:3-aminobutyryl-CoA ammonia-lyase